MKRNIIIPKNTAKDQIFTKLQSEKLNSDSYTLQIVFRMLKFFSQASQALEQHFQRYHLSQPGFLTLMLLYSDLDRGWTAIELAKELDVKPPTMTGILDTLEKVGYLTRIASTEDRRKNYIHLSSQGKIKFKKILPDHVLKIMNAFSDLSPKFIQEQEKLFSSLEQCLQKLVEDIKK